MAKKACSKRRDSVLDAAHIQPAQWPRENLSNLLKLHDVCDRIGVEEREVRYALARGIIPAGMTETPGRGCHRLFDTRQAIWLGTVLRLKSAGVHTPVAAEVVRCVDRMDWRSLARDWDWSRFPLQGGSSSEGTWMLEVGDHAIVRICTDAVRSRLRQWDATDWVCMRSGRIEKDATPLIIIQINVSALARLVAGDESATPPSHSPADAS